MTINPTVKKILDRALRDGGANGSIIGRNTFQRPRAEALKMLDQIVGTYKGEA